MDNMRYVCECFVCSIDEDCIVLFNRPLMVDIDR